MAALDRQEAGSAMAAPSQLQSDVETLGTCNLSNFRTCQCARDKGGESGGSAKALSLNKRSNDLPFDRTGKLTSKSLRRKQNHKRIIASGLSNQRG